MRRSLTPNQVGRHHREAVLAAVARREWPEPQPYDPEQARALLDVAGWVDRGRDGVREKDGRPFRFTATVT